MRATVMYAARDVRTVDVPDPSIIDLTDAIVRVTSACVCGSDLWPYADMAPSETGQSMGHEAIGIVDAARQVGVPVAISFTVETDGTLPSGMPLAQAIAEVDSAGGPDYFCINCAHPTHIEPGVAQPGAWRERIIGIRPNASTKSHAELDEAEELDDGNPESLAAEAAHLRPLLPRLSIVGGCCGTDTRHVARMWNVG